MAGYSTGMNYATETMDMSQARYGQTQDQMSRQYMNTGTGTSQYSSGQYSNTGAYDSSSFDSSAQYSTNTTAQYQEPQHQYSSQTNAQYETKTQFGNRPSYSQYETGESYTSNTNRGGQQQYGNRSQENMQPKKYNERSECYSQDYGQQQQYSDIGQGYYGTEGGKNVENYSQGNYDEQQYNTSGYNQGAKGYSQGSSGQQQYGSSQSGWQTKRPNENEETNYQGPYKQQMYSRGGQGSFSANKQEQGDLNYSQGYSQQQGSSNPGNLQGKRPKQDEGNQFTASGRGSYQGNSGNQGSFSSYPQRNYGSYSTVAGTSSFSSLYSSGNSNFGKYSTKAKEQNTPYSTNKAMYGKGKGAGSTNAQNMSSKGTKGYSYPHPPLQQSFVASSSNAKPAAPSEKNTSHNKGKDQGKIQTKEIGPTKPGVANQKTSKAQNQQQSTKPNINKSEIKGIFDPVKCENEAHDTLQDDVGSNAVAGVENGEKKVPAWKVGAGGIRKKKKMSPAKRNLQLRKYVQPKNAAMCLSELVRGVVYSVEQESVVGGTPICVSVEVNGQKYRGFGSSKQIAKQAAAEAALVSFVKPPTQPSASPVNAPGTPGAETEEENTPWGTLASFAMYKLFNEWREGRIGMCHPGFNSVSPFGVPMVHEATMSQAKAFQAPMQPMAAMDTSNKSAQNVFSTYLGAASGVGVTKDGMQITEDGKQVPKPAKALPENATSMHPVMLLHQMRPKLAYNQATVVRGEQTIFTLACNIDGKEFVGEGTKLKKAKYDLAVKANRDLFGIVSTYTGN